MSELKKWSDVSGYDDDGGVKPGDVVITASGARLLVGDINRLGGVCDDCMHPELRRDALVRVERKP